MALLNVVIDISHHNTITNFQQAKDSGVIGVIHKATEGATFVDAKYNERRVQANSVGLFWGAYHFGVRGNVQGQVDHFIEYVNPGPTDLVILDFEPNPREGTMTLAEAESFVDKVNAQIARFPGLYSDKLYQI